MSLYITYISNAIALVLIAAMFISSRTVRSGRYMEIKYFRRLILSVVLLTVSDVIEAYLISIGVDYNTGILTAILIGLPNVFTVIAMSQWMIFVDVSLMGSPDRIHRKYRFEFLAAVVDFALIAITFLVANEVETVDPDEVEEALGFLVWLIVVFLLEVGYGCYCLFRAMRIARYKENELKQASMVKFRAFMIPAIISFFLYSFTQFEILSLGLAISIIATYLSMRLYIKILDEETGFYDEDFFDYTALFFKKQNEKGCAILFSSDGDPLELAEVIRAFRPEKSTVVRYFGRKFIIIADITDIAGIEFLTDTVKEAYSEMYSDTSLQTGYYITEPKENFNVFLKRVISDISTETVGGTNNE